MSLPIATTEIDIISNATDDPFMTPTGEQVLASNLNAHIDHKTGLEVSNQRGEQQYTIYCDLVTFIIPNKAWVVDRKTSIKYEIIYSHNYDMSGTVFDFLSHTEIGGMKVVGSLPGV